MKCYRKSKAQKTFAGLIFSMVLAVGGIFAFTIHTWFIRKGREEFTSAMSRFILCVTLILSSIQILVTIELLLGGRS